MRDLHFALIALEVNKKGIVKNALSQKFNKEHIK
jgi:hypothetical protein